MYTVGENVWVLYVDVTCLKYNSNAFDNTVPAVVAALEGGL